jgi:hypothetical protein
MRVSARREKSPRLKYEMCYLRSEAQLTCEMTSPLHKQAHMCPLGKVSSPVLLIALTQNILP